MYAQQALESLSRDEMQLTKMRKREKKMLSYGDRLDFLYFDMCSFGYHALVYEQQTVVPMPRQV